LLKNPEDFKRENTRKQRDCPRKIRAVCRKKSQYRNPWLYILVLAVPVVW
jgi:hypothetical protein